MADSLDIMVRFSEVNKDFPDLPLSDALHFYSLEEYTSKTPEEIQAMKDDRLHNYLCTISSDYRKQNKIPDPPAEIFGQWYADNVGALARGEAVDIESLKSALSDSASASAVIAEAEVASAKE